MCEKLFTDEQARTFYIAGDQACYVDEELDVPRRRRRATASECATYRERRRALWLAVLKYHDYACRMARAFGLDDEAVSDVGIDAVRRAAHSWRQGEGSTLDTWVKGRLRFAFLAERCFRTARATVQLHPDTAYVHRDFMNLENAELIQLLIGELPEYERALLALHYVAGMTHVDIAEIVGCSKSTICRQIREATRRARARAWELGIVTGRSESDWE